MFLHVQSTKTSKMKSPYFFNHPFKKKIKCAPFFSKIEEDFNIDD